MLLKSEWHITISITAKTGPSRFWLPFRWRCILSQNHTNPVSRVLGVSMDQMNLILSKALPSESEAVFLVLMESALWLESRNISQWPVDWLETKKGEIFNSIDQGNFYILRADVSIEGVVEIKSQPEQLWGNDNTPSFYIHKLAKRRNTEIKGVGEIVLSLISKIKSKLEVSKIRLDCVSSNHKLKEYYLSKGFEFCGNVSNGEVELSLYQKSIC